MTVRTPGTFNQSGSYGAIDFRQLLASLIAPGVIKAADLLVSAHGTPNMSVDVAAGSAVVAGTQNPNQGSYYFFNDAVVNLVIAASDPTNPRNDLIVARIQDADYTPPSAASLAVVTGTPAGSPVDPALPANSLVLARVRVDATVTTIVAGKVTDLRVQPSKMPVLSGIDATIAGVAPALGVGPFFIQGGAHAGVTNGTGLMTLVFPTPFPNGLLAIVAVSGINAGNETCEVINASSSKTQAVIQFYNANSNTVVNTQARTFNWIAIGF
jgi:hypothetical protein